MGHNVIRDNIRAILIEQGQDPDLVIQFLEEQLQMMRASDEAMSGVLSTQEFYKREIRYSKIERFIIHLK